MYSIFTLYPTNPGYLIIHVMLAEWGEKSIAKNLNRKRDELELAREAPLVFVTD